MLKRHARKELEALLKVFPVVLMTGARQSGKTTLMQLLQEDRSYDYYTFDDDMTRANAARDPSGWLSALKTPVVIDEVQHVPEIFLPIKRTVDQDRKVGQFVLTGSANPLFLPKLGDSLAGRMGIIPLYPFSKGEILQKNERFIEIIFSKDFRAGHYPSLDIQSFYHSLLRGGYPPAQQFEDPRDIHRWMKSYLQTMLEKDVRDISNVEGLREFPRLFRLLAARSSMLLNTSEISRSLGMSNATVTRYMRLLETLYFIYLLPAWYTNRGKRIVKSPKLHLCDTGIFAHLLDIHSSRLNEDSTLKGQILETFVFTELQKQKSWSETPFELYHFRNGGHEVDFVLEHPDGSLIGIEVKGAKSLRSDDCKGLKYLKSLTQKQFYRGIVLYQGDQVQQMEERIFAMPIQSLWL